MKKNGFTLVELLGVIVVLAIISGLAVISMNTIIGTGKKGVYHNYEKTLIDASRNYYIDNMDKIPNVGSPVKLYAEFLVQNGYIDNLKDPNGGECIKKDSHSYVLVTRESDINNNFNLNYKACLICQDTNGNNTYKSDDC